jgi:tRNA(Ile)-lysidine synthase
MNWRALCGIPGKRDKIVRPMLGITGKQAREYCRSRGVMFLEDPTNRENSFARNRLRNLTLPALGRTFHPDVASLLVRLSRLSDSLVNFERGILNRSPKAPDQSIEFLDLVNWRRFPEILKESVLIAFLENGMKSYPSASLLEDINDFLLGKATGTMDLPGGLQLDVAHEKAVIRPTFHKERNALPSRPVKIVVPGRTELAVSGLAIETELRPFSGDLDLSDPDLAFLSLEKAGSSLYARRRQQGDRITPLGMGKVKKLKELLINRKIPKKTRDSIPIVVDASGDIVWVGGVEISEKAALDRYDGEMMIILRLERSGSA